MEACTHYRKNSNVEGINWVCETIHDNRGWMSSFRNTHKQKLEALNYDINVPFPVHCAMGMLWCSAPTSVNNDALNDGVILFEQNKKGDQFGHHRILRRFLLETAHGDIVLLAGTLIDDEELFTAVGVETRKGDEGMGTWRKT